MIFKISGAAEYKLANHQEKTTTEWFISEFNYKNQINEKANRKNKYSSKIRQG